MAEDDVHLAVRLGRDVGGHAVEHGDAARGVGAVAGRDAERIALRVDRDDDGVLVLQIETAERLRVDGHQLTSAASKTFGGTSVRPSSQKKARRG